MSYLENELLKSEKLLLIAKPNWVIFSPCALFFIFGLFVMEYGKKVHLFNHTFGYIPFVKILEKIPFFTHLNYTPVYQIFAYIIFIVAIIFFLIKLITLLGTEYGITNYRLILKHGIIVRHAHELFLEKIEEIEVYQSIVGRIFRFGTVSVVGTGGSRDKTLPISNPLHFRRVAQQQIENAFENYRKNQSGRPTVVD